ncbi:MAG: hypothetical protein ACRDNI_06275 [Gaiellaceae bacterium]
MATSDAILGEVHRKLTESFDHSPEQALQKRFAAATFAVRRVEYFEPVAAAPYTGDSRADSIIHTALLGDTDHLLSDDKKVVGDGDGTRYSDIEDRHSVRAYSVDGYAELLETSTFSLDAVPPDVLTVQVGDRPVRDEKDEE